MTNRKAQSLEAALIEAERQFSTRPYEEVSVNEIAAIAHCSTTTIYDVYGSKTGLYLAAARSYLERVWEGVVAKSHGGTALERLVTLLEARAEGFSTFELRETVRNLIARVGRDNLQAVPEVRSMFVGQLMQIIEIVNDAAQEGVFRDLKDRVLADAILAGVDWRPVMHGMFFGSADQMNYTPIQIVARTLLPLLSDKGLAAYEALRPGVMTAAVEAGPVYQPSVIKT
jgi:AcrR family transcriptional regulator